MYNFYVYIIYFHQKLFLTKVSLLYKDAELDIKESVNETENPCWDGYQQVGTKTKNGKEVPNCVPKK